MSIRPTKLKHEITKGLASFKLTGKRVFRIHRDRGNRGSGSERVRKRLAKGGILAGIRNLLRLTCTERNRLRSRCRNDSVRSFSIPV